MLSSLFCRQTKHSSEEQLAADMARGSALSSLAGTCCRADMAWLHSWLFMAAQCCSRCLRNAALLLLEPWAALTGSIACSCSGKW